jgi:isoleucyl-tRNA synthetase
MRRVPEVLDCWFESGSMSYAQVHYPFENKEWFENHFPADFTTEYMAQTRGWFYTMTVLSTALFDRPPFRNCLCHGVILDAEGKKLSKRLRNYPDPEEIFETIGSDALRWFLVSSPVMRGGELRIERDGKQIAAAVRRVINPIWNAYYFFCLYANADDIQASLTSNPRQILDRYIIAKTHELVTGMQEDLDAYDLSSACHRVLGLIDALNNWYIRRSRPRFWRASRPADGASGSGGSSESGGSNGSGDDADKRAAYDTLYTVLLTLCQVVSPLLPLISDEIYRGLTAHRSDLPDSVHLTDWPDAVRGSQLAADPDLVADMDRVRDVCSSALALRAAKDVRVRQPLAELVVAGPNAERLRPYIELITDEVNVKSVRLTEEIDAYATFKLQVNARVVGPRLGARTKQVIAASKQGDWRPLAAGGPGEGGGVEVAGETLAEGEYSLLLEPKDGVACEPLPGNDAIVVLDLALSPELVNEGLARDVVRVIQQARKEADLHVADRIRVVLDVPNRFARAVESFRDYVCEQTLAVDLTTDDAPIAPSASRHEAQIGGEALRIAIARA